jgi:hypothetical protein
MANETYTLIQKTTLNASAASITLSNIPQTFTDLVIRVSLKTTRTTDYVDDFRLTFNGSSTGYGIRGVANYNGTLRADTNTSAPYIYANAATASHASQTPSTFCNSEIYVPNYTSANNKSVSIDSTTEQNGTQIWQDLQAAIWSNSAAITSVTLVPDVAANFTQYSSVSLYGVAKLGVSPVAGPKASGGDIVVNDGTYWYHLFVNSGTFAPLGTLTADITSCGGGGGGGNNGAGGGGGGELDIWSSNSLSASAYAVTIGAGGVGSTTNGARGTNGGTSSFGSLVTSLGGGNGGGALDPNGATGGSGGGGSGNASPAGTAGGASGSNTFAGGAGAFVASAYGAGGGGGATAAGSAGTGSAGGNGGAGYTLTSISSYLTSANLPIFTGMTVINSGGGGAGAGTAGTAGTGGGNGQTTGNAASAVSFGSGGGGGGILGATRYGGNGFAGIVIIRYAI